MEPPAPSPSLPQTPLRRRRRRWRYLAATAIVLLVVTLAVLAALQIVQARRELLDGAERLNGARHLLTALGGWHDPAMRGRAQDSLRRAEADFANARANLHLISPVLAHLEWVPQIGGQMTAASPVADAALSTTRAILHLLAGLEPLWPAIAHSGPTPCSVRVAHALAQGGTEFTTARMALDSAQRSVSEVPAHTGNLSLDRDIARLRVEVPTLRSLAGWLEVAPLLLGVGRPNHELIVFQNSDQIRATGGFLGALDELTLREGVIGAHFNSSALSHEITSVAPPLPQSYYTFEGPWLLRDANWSPDFPLSARLERWFYGEDTGHWVDGVISVNDAALPRLLTVTGPIRIPQFGITVRANDLKAITEHFVNGGYHGPLTSGPPDTVRKQILGAVFGALLPRLVTLPPDRWSALGDILATAVARRDLMLYDRRPAVEALIRQSGSDGTLRSAPGDLLAVIDDNRSYNKLNPYVRESATYRVTISPNGLLDATLTLRYRVDPSPESLEGNGPAYGVFGTKHDYLDFLRVYVPAGARLLDSTGLSLWAPLPAYGLEQFAGEFLLRAGKSATVALHYHVPPTALTGQHAYHLTIRHQPGSTISSIRVSVRGPNGVHVDRMVPLQEDAHLTVPLPHSVNPAPAHLRIPSGPVDPYIQFDAFHDPRHPL